MKISLILAPYDSGHRHSGAGQGPDALIAGGLVETLTLSGHDVTVEDIGRVGDKQLREIATGFDVCRAVAAKVAESRDDGVFPIVLCGNCLTASGAIAGESADSLVWFDQHGDINTPETSRSGFLDGMALSVALGQCWKPLAATIPGFSAIDPTSCMLVDARDLDLDEVKLLGKLPVIRSECEDVQKRVVGLQKAGVQRTHIHLDLDVHNAKKLHVNRYSQAGGPGPEEVREAVACIARSVPVVGMTISAYDPAYDARGDVPPAVGELLVDFLAALERI